MQRAADRRRGAPRPIGLPQAVVAVIGAAVLTATTLVVSATTPASASPPSNCTGTPTVTCTFAYSGAAQTFNVPSTVTQVTVTAYGAQGGTAVGGAVGGPGGEAVETLNVTPGSTLYVYVGGQGTGGGAGGFNGGGAGGIGTEVLILAVQHGGGGGGASDVRSTPPTLTHRLVVAGGGGGGGGVVQTPVLFVCTGGVGGGSTGGTPTCQGTGVPPGGGTQTAGGEGGQGVVMGGSGGPGQGGQGGSTTTVGLAQTEGGGGGGGGWYGGGGGGASTGVVAPAYGGAGGSGYAPTGTLYSGVNVGNGEVLITYQAPTTSTPTTTTVTTVPTITAAASNQTVTLRATVTAGGTTVGSGTVTFGVYHGSTLIGTATSASVAAGTAQASYTLPATTPPGTYVVEAVYTDANGTFAPSSNDSRTLTVDPITTTTDVLATPAQPTAGQSITLKATVGATTVPTSGTVAFSANGTLIGGCGAALISAGVATCTTTFPSAGSVTVDAAYRDTTGGIFGSSSGRVVLPVQAAVTTTAVTVAPSSVRHGATVTYAATVSSASGTPTGTVAFSVGMTTLCAATLDTGSGSCTATDAPVGADTVTGAYSGDGAHAKSSGTAFLTVTSLPGITGTTPGTNRTTSGLRRYSLGAADGGVFAFGGARFYGSMVGTPLNAPVVGMAATPTGNGYWEVAADGGVFTFGSLPFYGSMGGMALDAPVVGMAV